MAIQKDIENRSNVIKASFPNRKRIKFTEASIKKLLKAPIRSKNLDSWKEDSWWSDQYEGLGIRVRPRGEQQGNELPENFLIRYIHSSTPKGFPNSVKILHPSHPNSISVKEVLVWYKKNNALLVDGINPAAYYKQKKIDAVASGEPTIRELAKDLIHPPKFAGSKQLEDSTKQTYGQYLKRCEPIADKAFVDITPNEYFTLLESFTSSMYSKNVITFITTLWNRQEPRFKDGRENPKQILKRRFNIKSSPDTSRKKIHLAFAEHDQQFAQFYLALKYSLEGYTIREGSIPRWDRIITRKAEGDPRYFYSPEELEDRGIGEDELPLYDELANDAVVSAAKENRYIKPLVRYRGVIDALLFILLTGLRKENVLNLKWDDVVFNENHFLIPRMKLKEEPVIILMTNYTRALLKFREEQKQNNDTYVFCGSSRRKLSVSTLNLASHKIGLWMCLLGFTDEYPLIRGYSYDRDPDKLNPKTYRKNPIYPIIFNLGKWQSDLELEQTLDVLFPKLLKTLKELSLISIKESSPDLDVSGTLAKLGNNPHSLRRSLSNVAEYLQLPANIFLEHKLNLEKESVKDKHYVTPSDEKKVEAMTKCHEYIDNRIFESLGDKKFISGNHFLSPILSLFGEEEAYIKQDDDFNINKHSANPYGKEEETRKKKVRLKPYPTKKELEAAEAGEEELDPEDYEDMPHGDFDF